MVIVDANVLLDAVDEDSLQHEPARHWLDTALTDDSGVGFVWLVLVAFIRIATNERILPRPLSIGDAADQIDAHRAALAMEHGAAIVSFDRDFQRLDGVRQLVPPPVAS
ncbi:MAG: hypothetical protein KA758_07930 [Acidimicrobiales bacterium]|nr:hypothetical protein [Acidimicrobiales bacterium]